MASPVSNLPAIFKLIQEAQSEDVGGNERVRKAGARTDMIKPCLPFLSSPGSLLSLSLSCTANFWRAAVLFARTRLERFEICLS